MEDRLALAVPLGDVTALVAGLAGIGGGDDDKVSAIGVHLVLKPLRYATPIVAQYRPVEPGLGLRAVMEVSARLSRIGLRLRTPRHGLDVKVLQGDETVLPGEPCRGLLDPVVPTSDDITLQSVEFRQGLPTALRLELGGSAASGLVGPVLAGHPALEVFQPLQLGLRWLGHVPEGPVGRSQSVHAAAVETDHAVAHSWQWRWHVDEHEATMGPIDMDAGVGSYRPAHAHMDDDTPMGLLAGLDPSRRVHAGDDDHTAFTAGFPEDRVACLGGVAPADETKAATARLEAGSTATRGFLPLQPGEPLGVFDSVGGRQYSGGNTRHPKT